MFWLIFAAGLAVLCLGVLGVVLLFRPVINLVADWVSRRLFSDPYHENILEMVNVAGKIGPMDLAELELRAESGIPAKRPFGARRNFSAWEKIFFRPGYLSIPLAPVDAPIDTGVLLGPRAGRPLKLSIPIMIGGMAWGNALSTRTKIALAQGSALAGTATNTGSGAFLPQERAAARFLVIQLARGAWMRDPEILRQADMIEIQLGHGAIGSAPNRIQGTELAIDPDYQISIAADRSVPLTNASLPEGPGAAGLKELVAGVRAINGEIPIGVKIGATDRLEEELALILEAGPDFLAIDGAEGGTHGVAAALHDAVGIPTLAALCRADRFLRLHGRREQISLLCGGGLYGPAEFLKAMALGADAVFSGTGALLALAHTQIEKTTPFEPPTELLFHQGKRAAKFDPELGARYLANYLQACVAEMVIVCRTLGKNSLRQVNRDDLCSLDAELALQAGIRWAGCLPAPEDRAGANKDRP
jgi:methylamine---glutamate N-methyltransferase subunit C